LALVFGSEVKINVILGFLIGFLMNSPGEPSALHSTLALDPCAKALSVGSRIHLGGTVCDVGFDVMVLRWF
jgi:hypothetical protein